MKKIFNILLIVAGGLCAVIGVIGFFSSSQEQEPKEDDEPEKEKETVKEPTQAG